MPNTPSLHRGIAAAATWLGLIAAAGCSDLPSAADSHTALYADAAVVTANASVASPGLVKEVHAATARFHSTTQATKGGYVLSSPCIAHPTLGGMGFHWVNNAKVDPVFDPLEPEALVYAPDASGAPKLAAVEYIVIDIGQPAPTFDGHPFDVGGTPVPVPHWSLHVWLDRDNPSGIFAPFNPDVTCS